MQLIQISNMLRKFCVFIGSIPSHPHKLYDDKQGCHLAPNLPEETKKLRWISLKSRYNHQKDHSKTLKMVQQSR